MQNKSCTYRSLSNSHWVGGIAQSLNHMLEDLDIFAGTPGNAMLHEVTEAYSGALISPRTGISAQPANPANLTYWIYKQAHNAKTTVPQPR